MDWNALKDEAARMLLEKDALHIYAALLIQLGAARAFRRSLGHSVPWLCVLAIELINEAVDLGRGGEPHLMPWQVVSGVHDIINTMILPTVLLMLSRRAPDLFAWPGRQPGAIPARKAVEPVEQVLADECA
jgi:hypothetical protein